MRSFQKVALILLPVFMLALASCGGSSSSSTSDPFSRTVGSGTDPATPTTPITAQDPAFSLALATDLTKPSDLTLLPQVDVNIGTVQLSAQLLNVSGGVFIDPTSKQSIAPGAPVPNQQITFNILAGPGAIGYITPVTDKNGVSKALFTTGNVNFTTNVIVEAAATVDGKNYRAYTSFQIVRGTGVIMFTSAAGTTPGGQSNILPVVDKTVDATVSTSWNLLQLIPFKVTDSNGNPRVGVPVTISLFSVTSQINPTDYILIDFLVQPTIENSQQTITTDSAGQGIFNASAHIATPPPGGTYIYDVVFKAVTNDAIPVTAYVGDSFSLTAKPAPSTPATLPIISPSTATFDTFTDLTFTITGGVPPYAVFSSFPSHVTATIQPDGVTVSAHLVDPTAWTTPVTIYVTDSKSQSVSATVNR